MLAKLIKREKYKLQILITKEDITIEPKNINRAMREYYKQFYANKFTT